MTDYIIRPATPEDLPAITEIYNQAVAHTVATFDTEEKSVEDRRAWFGQHGPNHPVFVAESNGTIAGWAALSPWSNRPAYAGTAEGSIYVREGCQGEGLGRRLSETIITAGREAGLHTLIARIAEGNDASLHLAESMGFQHIGVMKEVGFKFGRWLNVVMMQLMYD
jgi:L-amino acid N-acyltransferase YncA